MSTIELLALFVNCRYFYLLQTQQSMDYRRINKLLIKIITNKYFNFVLKHHLPIAFCYCVYSMRVPNKSNCLLTFTGNWPFWKRNRNIFDLIVRLCRQNWISLKAQRDWKKRENGWLFGSAWFLNIWKMVIPLLTIVKNFKKLIFNV